MHRYDTDDATCYYCGDDALKVRTDYVAIDVLVACLRIQQQILLDAGVEDFDDIEDVA